MSTFQKEAWSALGDGLRGSKSGEHPHPFFLQLFNVEKIAQLSFLSLLRNIKLSSPDWTSQDQWSWLCKGRLCLSHGEGSHPLIYQQRIYKEYLLFFYENPLDFSHFFFRCPWCLTAVWEIWKWSTLHPDQLHSKSSGRWVVFENSHLKSWMSSLW